MSPLRFFAGFESPVEPNNAEEIIAEDRDPTNEFDAVIGAIEEIVIEDRFQEIQHNLLEKYHHHFEDTEENKLIYTEIFELYTTEIENYIETELSQRFIQFSMEQFLAAISERESFLDGDIFELLYSLSDFLVFKELFVDYKNMKNLDYQSDLSDLLSVSSINK